MTNLPVTGEFTVTAVYGQQGKYWKNGHKGIDIVSANRDVYATCDGTVRVTAFDDGGWGRYITIGADDGYIHVFCHLKDGSVCVKTGDRVTRQTVIAVMGDTGNATGVHLHYQINTNDGTPTDPTSYLKIPNLTGIYNSADYTIGGNSMNYKDEKEISDWAKSAVESVTEAGLMLGDDRGYFNPKGYITREQMAVIIERLTERK